MKKILLLVAGWFIIAGCTKQASAPEELTDQLQATAQTDMSRAQDDKYGGIKPIKSDAYVHYHDRYGWILLMPDKSFEKPVDLPKQFQRDFLGVRVVYYHTDKPFYCACTTQKYYIHLEEIEATLNAQPAAE